MPDLYGIVGSISIWERFTRPPVIFIQRDLFPGLRLLNLINGSAKNSLSLSYFEKTFAGSNQKQIVIGSNELLTGYALKSG